MATGVGLSPARRAALRALASARSRDAYILPVVLRECDRARLTGPERALSVRLALGVIETQGVLDDAIDAHARSRIEPRVRDALRVATYEMLYMRTPGRAAVHQGVEAAKAARPQAGALANAILRRIAEDAESFPWGDPAHDIDAAARLAGYPVWMVRLVSSSLGPAATAEFLASARTPAPLYLRVNPLKTTTRLAAELLASEGVAARPAPPDEASLIVDDERAVVASRALAEGAVIVMDAAAQVAPLAVGPQPAGRIVEIGAGRGAKTAALQWLSVSAGGTAAITAVDVHAYRTELLTHRMRDLGVEGVDAVTADVRISADDVAMPRSADAVLVDAPCSGIGTLRRHQEIVWRVSPEDIARLGRLQSDMLAASARLVRPGGVVVYSTCSVTRAENADVVYGFLGSEGGADFALENIASVVPREWARFITQEGFFQSWPTPGGPDGHFVARLRRRA
ncbi:MAG: hypothetical protein LLG24_03440 [Actinomycetia bacterium]|nr:hypothetical protein [Actinomycetes bacterium]